VQTFEPDTFVFMAGIPCLNFAGFATVEDLFASGTSSQPDANGTTAFVTVLKQWLPTMGIKIKMIQIIS